MNDIKDKCKALEEADAVLALKLQRQINYMLLGKISALQMQINTLSGSATGIVEEIRGNRTKWRKPLWREQA